MQTRFERFLSALANVASLGQLKWVGLLVGGLVVAVFAKVKGVPWTDALIISLVVFVCAIILGVGVGYWLARRRALPAVAPSPATSDEASVLVTKYFLRNLETTEAEARRLREESFGHTQEKQTLQEEVAELQRRLGLSYAAAKELNGVWSKIAHEAIAMLRTEAESSSRKARVIEDLSDILLSPPLSQGLLLPAINPTPEERFEKASEIIRNYVKQSDERFLLDSNFLSILSQVMTEPGA